MTGATHQAWARSLRDEAGELPKLARLEIFSAGRSFQIADVTVSAFTIPHDAADPVGFTFRAEGTKIAVATDLGYIPASVCDHLRKCDVLVVESNHDLEMLRVGPYPWSVKQRVMSRVGHLSNESLAQFFAKDYDGGASYIVLAHLSEQNNHPEVARRAAESALGPQRTLLQNQLMLAAQDAPTDFIHL
jgi:phosphoribosyl 1,2-cyclic phosphodiesterase